MSSTPDEDHELTVQLTAWIVVLRVAEPDGLALEVSRGERAVAALRLQAPPGSEPTASTGSGPPIPWVVG